MCSVEVLTPTALFLAFIYGEFGLHLSFQAEGAVALGKQGRISTRCWIVYVKSKVGVRKAFEFGGGAVECRQSIFLHLSC